MFPTKDLTEALHAILDELRATNALLETLILEQRTIAAALFGPNVDE